ncbi:hypothetical protein [Rhodoferax ferrireducens]|uniref:hypothetical protein n=1 Tax=Rhodoferax ferrireducens TaxID=192843 RepID=UPI00385018DA
MRPRLAGVVEPVGHRVLHIAAGVGAQRLQQAQGSPRLGFEGLNLRAPDAARAVQLAGEAADVFIRVLYPRLQQQQAFIQRPEQRVAPFGPSSGPTSITRPTAAARA